jgi:uncharacterized membrane protein YcgQ (UPF0703/DUF1980 family)
MRRALAASLLTTLLAASGCGPVIAELNSHPAKHYQATVTITGEIVRKQAVGGVTVLEIADAREKRILVKADGPVDAGPTDWVKVKGLFVPETTAGTQTLYDVVIADSVSTTSPPWFRNLD